MERGFASVSTQTLFPHRPICFICWIYLDACLGCPSLISLIQIREIYTAPYRPAPPSPIREIYTSPHEDPALPKILANDLTADIGLS